MECGRQEDELGPPGRRRARARRWRHLVLAAALATLVALLMLNALFAVPRYRGPASDHFDGRVFQNAEPIARHGLLEFLRWRLEREGGAWAGYEAPSLRTRPARRVAGDELVVTFVGHATLLLQTAGWNVLTDPIWSERASPVSWAGPRRHVAPGVDFEALPPIDVVLVSHNHYDHLDLPTLARLAEEHGPAIYAPLGNAALLEENGIAGARDLDWWDAVELADGLRLTCVPAQHFSGRSVSDRNRALWGGFVLETPGGAIYFAGDTGAGPHFARIRRRFGEPRLALLPIGAYLPRWFMEPVHLDPREAAQAHLDLGARTSVGMHFGCFELADDGPRQPVEELAEARAALGIDAEAFTVLPAGGVLAVP